jgi:hypothetical protein
MLQVIKDLFTNIFELFSLIILIHYKQNIKDNLFNYYHNCYKLGTIHTCFYYNSILKDNNNF